MSISQKASLSRREARKAELMETWSSGKRGQMLILSKFHRTVPSGEGLGHGTSVIDLLVEKEFGPLPAEQKPMPPVSEQQAAEQPTPEQSTSEQPTPDQPATEQQATEK